MDGAGPSAASPTIKRVSTTTTEAEPAAPEAPRVVDLRPGQRFSSRFACVRKDRLTARNGSTYLSLELRDRSGTLPARVFREADRIGLRFEAGDAIRVKGRIERFRGDLVAELDDAQRIEPGSYEPSDFLPSAYRAVEELEGFLEHLISEIHHDGLRGVAVGLLLSGSHAGEFRRAPCTQWGHHAYLGGLLEHTVAVGTLVLETCQLHPRLNPDLLLTAALVHDVGKVREFTYGAEFGISEEGRMLGHLQLGAGMVDAAADGLPHDLRLALVNCVLSHHGPADSARGRERFATPEALALYRVNALDAGVKGALESGRRE